MTQLLSSLLVLTALVPLAARAQTTDATAPSAPAHLTIVGVLSTEIDLSWGVSTDEVGVVGYKIYRAPGASTNFAQVATSTTTSFENTGLQPATSYTYRIRAYDAAGNVSAESNSANTTTLSSAATGAGSASGGGTSTGGAGASSGAGTGGAGTSGTGSTQPPLSSEPYQFKRQGIFDCNQNGAYAMSVGSLGAIGGVYVPVADAAVELNTGVLVYKECILREVINREREAAMSAFLKKGYTGVMTGRDGNPQFVVNQGQEELTYVADPQFLSLLESGAFDSLDPTLKSSVIRTLAQRYQAKTRAPENALKCPYEGDLASVRNGTPDKSIWDALTALENPACTFRGAYLLSEDYVGRKIAQALEYQRNQWSWGNGYYAGTDGASDPLARKTRTPSITIQQSFQTLFDSPVRQLESANDIGQMISALYGGVTTQVLSDSQGLTGLARSSGGQTSYLDQIAKESAQGVRNAAVNTGLSILNEARQVEANYLETVNKIAATLTKAINDLRGAERQCWNTIIQKTCATPVAADNTCISFTSNCTDDGNGGASCTVGNFIQTAQLASCTITQNPTTITCPVGSKLKVATSTAYSQAIIDPQITPLATETLNDIKTSQTALRLITNLVTSITNTASLNAQRLALQQLDSLVVDRALHLKPDLTNKVEQKTKVDAAMATLVEDTVKSWADSPGAWCNTNDKSVIASWTEKWRIK